jgi:hypothetical protein
VGGTHRELQGALVEEVLCSQANSKASRVNERCRHTLGSKAEPPASPAVEVEAWQAQEALAGPTLGKEAKTVSKAWSPW